MDETNISSRQKCYLCHPIHKLSNPKTWPTPELLTVIHFCLFFLLNDSQQIECKQIQCTHETTCCVSCLCFKNDRAFISFVFQFHIQFIQRDTNCPNLSQELKLLLSRENFSTGSQTIKGTLEYYRLPFWTHKMMVVCIARLSLNFGKRFFDVFVFSCFLNISLNNNIWAWLLQRTFIKSSK